MLNEERLPSDYFPWRKKKLQEECSLWLPSCAAVAENWSCLKMIFFIFLSWLMKRDFAGREELPSILCFIFFKLERWQKAAGAPWCQEWFWQTLPPHQGGRKSCYIFLDKPGSNLLRNRETGELGKIFLPFLSFFTLFLLDFLLFFWISCRL